MRDCATEIYKGIFLILGGIILLLHTLGVLTVWIDRALAILSIVMIIYGMFKAKLHIQLQKALKKESNSNTPQE